MIYFIRNGNYIKIGVSVDPWKRLASLQTGNPEPLELLAIMPGSNDLEIGLHRAFGQFMKQGEWFQINDRLLTFIKIIKDTFPDSQRNLAQEEKAQRYDSYAEEMRGMIVGEGDDRYLSLGESTTFRMTHKGHFRNPSTHAYSLWQHLSFYRGGYWQGYKTEDWWVLTANGMYFEFVDMQHVTITRTGAIHEGEKPYLISIHHALRDALNTALKEAIYNRKNNATWLGVYNTEDHGIVIAVKKVANEETVHLEVPDEVINYWRQYQYKSPLPDGVSIEA